MKRLKVGVIGCGIMGGFHLRQYGTIPEVEVIGASDSDPSKAQTGLEFFLDYHKLLERADAVSITTPTETHFQIGMDSLDSGCHVMVEKPITMNSEQAQRMIEKAKHKGLVLAVGHIESFNPAFCALLHCLKGRTPDIMDIKRYSPFPERITDASCVTDMMIHDIDIALRIAGSEVTHVNSKGKKERSSKLDQAIAILAFKNGSVANIEADRLRKNKVRTVSVMAGKQLFVADLLEKKLSVSENGRRKEIKVNSYDSLNRELSDFVRAVLTGRKPQVTGEDGLAALKIAEEVERIALKK